MAGTRKWHWFVYIIECQDGFYYTGLTWNLENRMEQHRIGKGAKFTTRHGFKELKYFEEFDDIVVARNRERQVKDYNRLKKESLWREK